MLEVFMSVNLKDVVNVGDFVEFSTIGGSNCCEDCCDDGSDGGCGSCSNDGGCGSNEYCDN